MPDGPRREDTPAPEASTAHMATANDSSGGPASVRRWWERRRGPWSHRNRAGRGRLRRRLFHWFASGVLVTAVAVAAVMTVLAQLEASAPHQTLRTAATWFAEQLALEWDDPSARDVRARRAGAALGLDLELLDERGARLLLVGGECRHRAFEAPIVRNGAVVGAFRACFAPSHGSRWRFFLGVGVAVAVLWVASGRVARRLARPLDELTDVVRRLGEGEMSARAISSCRAPDEFALVADAVNEMAARIERQMREQRELLATVSHELRTPLARLRVITELAREAGATAKTWEDLDLEVRDMDGLVGELLASARMEFGVLAMRAQPLRDVVQLALERAGVSAERAAFEGTSREASVVGDPTLLQRALANLLENAKRHAGGVDLLRAAVQGHRVSFEVCDRGPGLPRDGGGALFEKFRLHGGGPGLGLGLSLVRRVADAHHGRVWAVDREGGGATIGFELWSEQAPPDVASKPRELAVTVE